MDFPLIPKRPGTKSQYDLDWIESGVYLKVIFIFAWFHHHPIPDEVRVGLLQVFFFVQEHQKPGDLGSLYCLFELIEESLDPFGSFNQSLLDVIHLEYQAAFAKTQEALPLK